MQRLINLFRYMYSILRLLVGGYRSNRKFPLQMIFGRNCRIKGNGTMHISKGFVARDNCRLEAGSSGTLQVGIGCFLNNNVCITAMDSVIIGKNVCIGNNTVIVDHNHNFRHQGEGLFSSAPVVIGDNVWIGANVVVLPGTHVENDCVIGAGTILRGHVPSQSIVYDRQELIVRSIRG